MKKVILTPLIFLTALPLFSDSLSEAFKKSEVSGDLTIHSLNIAKESPQKDFGFINSSLGLKIETDTFYGFSSAVGFRSNSKISERNQDDAIEATGTLLTTANLQYHNDNLSIIAGRQEVELEWFEDYHTAIMITTDIKEDTKIVVGYSRTIADADDDEVSKFEDIGKEGVYVVDIQNNSFDDIVLNPYYMSVPKMFSAVGLKVMFDNDDYGLTLHYAQSNEKDRQMKDGKIFHIEARAKFDDFKLCVGKIKTDRDGGIGSLDEMGDHINPLEDGEYEINSVYEKDANTQYSVISYEIDDLLLSAMFRSTEYFIDAQEKEEKELDFSIEYEASESLESELVYARIFADQKAEDQDKLVFIVKYKF